MISSQKKDDLVIHWAAFNFRILDGLESRKEEAKLDGLVAYQQQNNPCRHIFKCLEALALRPPVNR